MENIKSMCNRLRPGYDYSHTAFDYVAREAEHNPIAKAV